MATRPVHRRVMDGPHPITVADIAPLNQVFSDAFTERYRRDGMVGVRVPFLNPLIWRYAIEDAGTGAMLWRDERGDIAAFNVAHMSGCEGWMGPLAARPDLQGAGLGKTIVTAGVEWLRAHGATTIGLETMPRTLDNIGFYARLGFTPGPLTLTLTLEAQAAERSPLLLGALTPTDRAAMVIACRELAQRLMPGYDFTREIELTDQLAAGDTVLLWSNDRLAGYALCHTAPLVEGRAREELRVLKLVLADEADAPRLALILADYARRSGARRVAIRVQGSYPGFFRTLVSLGARVRWSDLRMTLDGAAEPHPERGVVLSNWEI
ncbi:MAG: GNAT family N-acetyltransferase [Gemmatimonadetes bacterium]|nr:GNAT family N-acetyltransferase [Gemmatimonadota bacterium]